MKVAVHVGTDAPETAAQLTADPRLVVPFLNCTVPAGLAPVPVEVTVAVKLTLPPEAIEVGEAISAVVVAVVALTVNVMALLARPPTVTMTLPVVAAAGTGTAMLVALQLVGVPAVPLKVTVLVPCVAPKFVPAIVTDVPTGPDAGLRPDMVGLDVAKVKGTAAELLVL